MISNLPLGITVSLHRLLDLLVPPPHILKDSPTDKLPKAGPVEVPLGLGYLRNLFIASDIIDEPLNKTLRSKNALSLNFLPKRLPPHPLPHKPPVLLLHRPSKLMEDPVCAQAGMGLSPTFCSPITAPLPSLRILDRSRPHGVKDDISACLKQITILLN